MCTCDPRSAVARAAAAFPTPSLSAINCATTAVCGKHTRPVAADRNVRFQPPLRERRWLFAAPTRSATKANTARDQALACGCRWRALHPKSATPTFDAGARARHEAELRDHATSHARGSKAQPRRREQSRINEWRATQLRGHDAAAHTAAAAIGPATMRHAARTARSEAHAREGRAPKRVEHGHGGVLPCRATGHRLEPQSGNAKAREGGRASARCALLLPPARARRLAELGAGKGNGPPTAGGTKARIIQPCDAPCDPQRGAPRTVHHTRAHDRPQEPP
ncbi:hypothetical protein ERJ75_000091400 [Trypanosoma vivax]|nr:hypothetical protein ERJ75_000091400 [Trypanosoma vivax]